MVRLSSAMTISIMLPLVRLWVRYRNPPLPLPATATHPYPCPHDPYVTRPT